MCFKPILYRATLFALSVLALVSTSHAQPVHVSAEGVGQVLIYPYYTTRNGWTTLLSIVNNDGANGKAIKLRFLEGKNGALVASLNVFLAANDIWTAAVVAGSAASDPPKLLSNDNSCTWPSLRTQGTVSETGGPVILRDFEFSNRGYVADGDSTTLQTIDRTREGYVQVIEMASIPSGTTPRSALVQQIATASYAQSQPPCSAISDADLFRYAGQIAAPTGGLSGAATLINVLAGASTEYSPVALGGFWAIGSNAPQITASASALPNLSSGGSVNSQVSYEGKTYFSKFNRSIDALSAVSMSEQLMGEHAYTADATIATTWVVVTPTKRFYTQRNATAPFMRAWDAVAGTACDDATLSSTDRNAVVLSSPDEFSANPPRPPNEAMCFVAQVIGFGYNETMFGAKNIYGRGFYATQSGGLDVATAGKEGGKTQEQPASPLARLVSLSGSVASVDPATGIVSVVPGPHTFYGLPMIGVAFSASSFKAGNPQQNFASGFRLNSTRRITTP